MASAIIKNAISKAATGHSPSDSGEEDANAQKYKLKVTASTTYKNSNVKPVIVNGKPCTVNNHCKVAVRVQEFQGVPGEFQSESPYFNDPAHVKDTYSIAFSWAPEQDISAEDLTWGIELVGT